MRAWASECKEMGALLECDPVICNEAPDDGGKKACRVLGEALV